jgi:hypothetical protein
VYLHIFNLFTSISLWCLKQSPHEQQQPNNKRTRRRKKPGTDSYFPSVLYSLILFYSIKKNKKKLPMLLHKHRHYLVWLFLTNYIVHIVNI